MTNLARFPQLGKEMKSIFALFIILHLLLVFNVSYARKDSGDYWKNMMKDQPMPKAIEDLLDQNQQSVSDAGKDPFVRDFDIRPNVILYHTHAMSKENKKPFVKNLQEENKLKFKEQEALAEQTIKKG